MDKFPINFISDLFANARSASQDSCIGSRFKTDAFQNLQYVNDYKMMTRLAMPSETDLVDEEETKIEATQ